MVALISLGIILLPVPGIGTHPVYSKLSLPAQFLFSLLHPWIAFRLGRGWSGKRRKKHVAPYEWKGEQEQLYRFAQEFSAKNHVDYYVFGHFHAGIDTVMPDGARFVVMGDWKTESNYLYFNGMSLCSGNSPKMEK